jgi:hypothetical protein
VAKPVKIVLWVAAFAVAAGAGAFVASRSNPFPPGVEDPGARSTATPATSSATGPVAWRLAMTSKTEHRLHEGGACRSDWVTKGYVVVRPNGNTTGTATAKVQPGAGCPFPQSQVQLTTVQIDISGSLAGSTLTLSLDEVASSPIGAHDLGGFIATLPLIDPEVSMGVETGEGAATASDPDGDQGSYVSRNEVQLTLQ